jgi:hypothetical protein
MRINKLLHWLDLSSSLHVKLKRPGPSHIVLGCHCMSAILNLGGTIRKVNWYIHEPVEAQIYRSHVCFCFELKESVVCVVYSCAAFTSTP